MNLYRATYARADGSERHITFAAPNDADAQRTAAQWSVGDKLVAVVMDRPLQAPLLVLE